jgi:hypothetical protein
MMLMGDTVNLHQRKKIVFRSVGTMAPLGARAPSPADMTGYPSRLTIIGIRTPALRVLGQVPAWKTRGGEAQAANVCM